MAFEMNGKQLLQYNTLCNKNEIGISTFKDVTQVFKKYSFPISKLRPKSVFHESLTPGEEFFGEN